MREILFRGKTELFGNWIEGSLIIRKDLKSDKLVYLIATLSAYYAGIEKVIPETVGQYIGFDKDGKKIFEGDIVTQPVRETRKHSPCVIEFYNGKFQAHYISDKRFYDRYYDINSYTKVIGNIHDNPELLGGDE